LNTSKLEQIGSKKLFLRTPKGSGILAIGLGECLSDKDLGIWCRLKEDSQKFNNIFNSEEIVEVSVRSESPAEIEFVGLITKEDFDSWENQHFILDYFAADFGLVKIYTRELKRTKLDVKYKSMAGKVEFKFEYVCGKYEAL
jgi:hypothetical protein